MSIFYIEDKQPDEFAERAYSYRAWDWKDQAGVVARYDELRGCVKAEIDRLKEQLTVASDTALDLERKLNQRTPVYEAAMKWHAEFGDGLIASSQDAKLFAACEAAKS